MALARVLARLAAPVAALLALPVAASLALAVALLVLPVAAVLAVPPAHAADARCGPVETTPDEGHQHLLGDAPPPVGYRSTPPASGWHYRERDRVRLGVAPGGEPLTEPEQVSVLAVGGVVVSYRDLDPSAVETLEDVVAAAGERPVALTPYEALEPGEVALSAWRTVQRCDGADRDAVQAFVDEHAADAPDFTMSAGGVHDHAPADEAGSLAQGQARDDAGGGVGGRIPAEVLAVTGLALVAGFALLARRALRPPRSAGYR